MKHKDSILYFMPDDEFDFFHLFRMEGVLHAQLGKDSYKHKVTVLKWYDLVGFIIHKPKKDGENQDIHIVAKEYYDIGHRFKLWQTGDIIKVGGVIDKNGNFNELFREYDYGNPLPLRETDPEYKRLMMDEVMHTLPLSDMIFMVKNIKKGYRVAAGVINEVPTNIFEVKIRDTMRAVEDQQILDKVNYYLYYDDSWRLTALERRNDKGASIIIKIKKRSMYLLDKDIAILKELESNY